nr:putative universal stress protein [uncultured bacterium]
MKNILLPTDFSENSLNAINYALELFRSFEIDFFVLNVQKVSGYTTSELMTAAPSSSIYQGVLEDNKLKVQNLVKKLALENSSEKFNFEALLDYDVFTDALRQAVKSHEIDLIIMGTNGATGTKEAIFGSNTLKVIRNVNCPLLVVPEGYSFQNIKSVLFSNNAKMKISFAGLKPLKSILRRFKPVINVLEITEENIPLQEVESDFSIEDTLNEFEFKYFEIKDVPLLSAIKTFQQLIPIDLHALFIEKEGFIDRLIFGSATSAINYNSDKPLLIMHP